MNLKRKIFKIIPLWLIIVLAFSGTAMAAFTWISNPLRMSATVTIAPLTLTGGTWTTNPYIGVEYQGIVNFTVNRASSGTPQGYVSMIFMGAHSLNDISLRGQGSGPGGSGLAYQIFNGTKYVDSDYLWLVQGYPKLTGQGTQVEYLYGINTEYPWMGPYADAPLNFGPPGATSGYLEFYITYNTANSITVETQVTSSAS